MDARIRITQVVAGLSDTASGSDAGAEELAGLIYPELKKLAHAYMQGERAGHTLQATALVNEAYLRLVDLSRIDWRGRTHFFAVGARVMRRLLIDHARGRDRLKRGVEWRRVTLAETLAGADADGLSREELLELHSALERLRVLDARQARVVELRFFAGLGVAEVAEVLGVSKRTVEGDWTHARVWLKRELAA